jgi:hypothetical protein
MARARFSCPDGITVNELKSILSDCPVVSDHDDEVVYVLAGNGHLSALREVIIDDDNSIVLVPEFHGDVMRALETYGDFFGFEPEEEPEVLEFDPVVLN